MSNRRERRAAARSMKAAGVAVVVRHIAPAHSAINIAVDDALDDLRDRGADMTSRIVVTIGDDHPDYPGKILVEAKASRRVAGHEPGDDCPGCPIAHDTGE